MMIILVSKALTSPSAIPPSGWLARAWMANLLRRPQMPSGITEMGFIVQEKDPRKNEGVQKIRMHFHWSWTCKSYTINHSHLKIFSNGPECWGSHMVCLCNIWFGHLFGISMKVRQWQTQTHGCFLTPGHHCKGEMEEHVLKYMLSDYEYLGRSQKTENPLSLGESRELKRGSARPRS